MPDIKLIEELIEKGDPSDKRISEQLFKIKEETSRLAQLKKLEKSLKDMWSKSRNADGPVSLGDYVLTLTRFEKEAVSKELMEKNLTEDQIKSIKKSSTQTKVTIQPKINKV